MNWDQYFMSLVYLTSMKSKDESTKIGAVIVGPDKEIRSTGFNGLPRGVNDNSTDEDKNWSKIVQKDRHERPEKYLWYEHAERNAIYNAARSGIILLDTKMYNQGTPCADCGRAIIQAGINAVVINTCWEEANSEKWDQSAIRTKIMFQEAGVRLIKYSGDLVSEITGLHNGKIISLKNE